METHSNKSYSRINSAHPLNIDRERLLEENLSLKNTLSKISNEQNFHRKTINTLENEINLKDKIIEEYFNDNNFSKNNIILINNLKKKYKDLKKEIDNKKSDIQNLKKIIKNSKLNDFINENQKIFEKIFTLKNLYNNKINENFHLQQNNNENFEEKNHIIEALSKQDYILLNFQENNKNLSNEINNLNNEIIKLKNLKEKKTNTINKLKQKLKYQRTINEKLKLKRDNIKLTDEYITKKNLYENKLMLLRKDLAYFRDSSIKSENLLKEIKQFKNDNLMNNTFSSIKKSNRIIYSNNPKPFDNNEGFDENEINEKIKILQNKFQEEKKLKEKYLNEIKDLEDKINTVKNTETKVILKNSESSQKIKNEQKKIINYEIMSEFNLNEFIYILIKNLESKLIDINDFEKNILNENILNILKENKFKLFINTISEALIKFLKISKEKDKYNIHSFIKTFLYNNYIIKNFYDPNQFKNLFLSFFSNIIYYTSSQKEEFNKILASKFYNKKTQFLEIVSFFDENKKGFITFTTLKKILENLQLKFNNEILEYLIFLMKNYNDENTSLNELKYTNLINVIENSEIDPNLIEKNSDENNNKNSKENNNNNNNNNDDEPIEITNEEYLNNVKEIIAKIGNVLINQKKTFDNVFNSIVSKSKTEFKGIRLINLVEKLKSDFNIELSNIEIFCLFTKVKPEKNLSSKNNDEDDEDIEEIIDYNKFKNEVDNFIKNNNNNKNVKNSYKTSISNPFNNKSNTEKIKGIFNDFMKKHKFSYERFIFPIHCMVKLTTNGKKYNRYLDLEFFKHFLYQNGIGIQKDELYEFLNEDKLLFNNEKVNLDYLKFLISGRKGIRDNIVNEFMEFKIIEEGEMKENQKKIQKDFYEDDDEDDIKIK